MWKRLLHLRHKLATKLILSVGLTLLLSISTWAYFNINYQKQKLMKNVMAGADKLTTTIKLGTYYAMMLNSRDDITQIIQNIGKHEAIENIRIYNKAGQIKFSNATEEVDSMTNIKAEACDVCHRTDPPLSSLTLDQKIRIFKSPNGHRMMGVISPICNEPGCATDACHVHPEGKTILGALDVVVSLADTDREILLAERGAIGLAVFVFLASSALILILVFSFVNRPIQRLIRGTRQIARGDYSSKVSINRIDEMGQLADAINRMGDSIGETLAELNRQRDEYQTLFELVPCLITIQDRDFRLLRYNREFADRFDPRPGDYCFQAYKGRAEKCINCPVEKTFNDGLSHFGEETGGNRDGTQAHWIFKTTPIRNEQGEIVAALEMSLDITHMRQLEEKLEETEEKYHVIFNNIPNPVFVLDLATLKILDCNESVRAVYGYDEAEFLDRSFLELFKPEDRSDATDKLPITNEMGQVRHLHRSGREIFVNIRVSPSEYAGRRVLLVTISDITKRLETEQQLIQASKMATLGEMATGVAHELNQPLSVIKTVSSFYTGKIEKDESFDLAVLRTMLTKVDTNVDRATRIINHMRQFARKSDTDLEKTQVNDVIHRAFEIFSQQLKVRGIDVVWDIAPELPRVSADPGRLEQVFINLLLNARDAIEERWVGRDPQPGDKRITLRTRCTNGSVRVEVSDTGSGFSPSVATKIFEPFFTTKEVGRGTGLGLSISYGIVKECGGNIRAVSPPGKGARFILEFPVKDTNESHDS